MKMGECFDKKLLDSNGKFTKEIKLNQWEKVNAFC
jgi:hypothetical protein